MLRGTIRDHETQKRRPLVRFFACGEDISHDPLDTPLPDPIAKGTEPFFIMGAIAGRISYQAVVLRASLVKLTKFLLVALTQIAAAAHQANGHHP